MGKNGVNYQGFLRVRIQKNELATIGNKHSFSWETRSLVEASSGWTVLNQGAKPIAETVPLLEHGILELTQNRQSYLSYEIQFGIGTIDSTLEFYRALLEDCRQYPFAELYGCVEE